MQGTFKSPLRKLKQVVNAQSDGKTTFDVTILNGIIFHLVYFWHCQTFITKF